MITTFATVASISQPFNAGHTVEVKFEFDPMHLVEGELYIRIEARFAARFKVGDIHTVQIAKVP